MKDAGVEAFVEAIESHLRARRGVEHVLSPRDFALARSWFLAGVPLAAVLVALDRAFDAGLGVTSLAFCRRQVEALAAGGSRAPASSAPAPRPVAPSQPEAMLAALIARLQALRPGPGACFEPPLRRSEEVRDLLSVAARPNWDYVQRKLSELDADVSAAALRALPAGELAVLQAEAERAVVRHRGRVSEAALEESRARLVLLRAREVLGLPRVS